MMDLERDNSTVVKITINPKESAGNAENGSNQPKKLKKRSFEVVSSFLDICPSNKHQQHSRHKEFKIRNSVLTDLYEINHIKTIYNIFTASFILLFINIAINDLTTYKTFRLHFDVIIWNLVGIETMIYTWIIMFTYSLALYVGFKFWITARKHLLSSTFISVPPVFIMKSRLTVITSGVLIVEQLRLMMKSHAFARSNLEYALKIEKDLSVEQNEDTESPSFTRYLYFHFAPTLVYRNTYPRNENIRWKIVIWHFCEVFGIIFYGNFINEQFLFPNLRSFWDEQVTPIRVVALFFRLLFPTLMIILFVFYIIFHSWLNAFAELLRFGDRLFYLDWWTTTSFSAFYRTWNVVVHDWMFEYIYQDMTKMFSSIFHCNKTSGTFKNARFFSKMFVLVFSAIFHEYLIMISMRYCYPIMFILFGVFGVVLMYLPKKKGATGNIYLWLCLTIGNTLMITAYCVEYYARRQCHPYPDATLDFFIPRSWMCNATIANNY